ncbi:MFS transporter [Nocardia sp. NPDC051321]|uniref:MFS transporter n=1 Tax=Nocardia sp. NPDC051321 TaxID=3364323 RepID=UPI00379E5ECB
MNPIVRYAELFGNPGARRFVTAGFIARLTVSMASLGLVLALSSETGGYAAAGAVAGAFSLTAAIVAPRIGRLHDRYGQARVLPPLALTFGGTMFLIAIAIREVWSVWILVPMAMLGGATLPLAGPLIRARWTNLYRGTPQLRTCYAFEGATDEMVYIIGPLLVTVLATGIGPIAGLIAVISCAVVGALSLALQKSTQPPSGLAAGRRTTNAIQLPAMRVLFVIALGIGGVFGSMDIVTIGFVTAAGNRTAGGVLLGIWSAASLIAGLMYGARAVQWTLHRRYAWSVAAFAIGLLPLMLAHSLLSLAFLLIIAGLAMSLVLVIGVEIIERVIPAASITEGLALNSGGIGLGITLGSVVGGWTLDNIGTRFGYTVPSAFGLLSLIALTVGYRVVRGGCESRQ